MPARRFGSRSPIRRGGSPPRDRYRYRIGRGEELVGRAPQRRLLPLRHPLGTGPAELTLAISVTAGQPVPAAAETDPQNPHRSDRPQKVRHRHHPAASPPRPIRQHHRPPRPGKAEARPRRHRPDRPAPRSPTSKPTSSTWPAPAARSNPEPKPTPPTSAAAKSPPPHGHSHMRQRTPPRGHPHMRQQEPRGRRRQGEDRRRRTSRRAIPALSSAKPPTSAPSAPTPPV